MNWAVCIREASGRMITVRDCLALPELQPAQVVAGEEGLYRPVRLAHVIDEPDIAAWAARDVAVLTTFHNQPHTADYWVELIPALDQKGVAALFVATGRYIDRIPDEARDLSHSHRFPVITLPFSLPFVTVAEAIHRLIIEDNRVTWSKVSDIQIRVTESAVRAKSVEDLLRTFSEILSRTVDLVEIDAHTRRLGHVFPLGSPDLARWCLEVQGDSLSAPEQVIARQMAGVLAVYLLQQKIARQTEFEIQSTLLERIVLGQWQDDVAHRERLRLFGFHAERPHHVILLSLPDLLRVDAHQQARYEDARELIKRLLDWEDRLINVTSQGLVLLVGAVPGRANVVSERLRQYFEQFSDSTGLISGPLMLKDIPQTYQTMTKMLPLLEPGTLHHLGDALFPAVVAELPAELMQAFVKSTWGRVRDAVLYETLRAYVESGGRRLDTAERLGVHRNTVANRIEQIEALLGHVLDAPFLTQLDLAYRWMLTQTPANLS
jgi:purine catabolism regulator